MHPRTLEQLKEGVKIIGNHAEGNTKRFPYCAGLGFIEDGTYILRVTGGGLFFSVEPLNEHFKKQLARLGYVK